MKKFMLLLAVVSAVGLIAFLTKRSTSRASFAE